MFDLAAIGIAVACFAFIYLLLYVLGRVWCLRPTPSGSRSRCSSSRTSCTRSSVESAS